MCKSFCCYLSNKQERTLVFEKDLSYIVKHHCLLITKSAVQVVGYRFQIVTHVK